MNILDIELVNEPLDIDSFSYLNDTNYPVCLLGFQLKNLYDQKRLIIKNKYNPCDIIHFVPNDAVLPKFFRGIKINLKQKYFSLIKSLETLGTEKTNTLNLDTYKELLSQYKLSCDNCYAYLNKGIYPIDSEHINSVCTNEINLEELYCSGLESSTPLFQSIGYFVIYVLSNKNFYKTSTQNYLHAVVKKYNSL